MINELVQEVQRGWAEARGNGERFILGITGAPGSGKSTLTLRLCFELAAQGVPVVAVPMDGFHLADVELERLGRRRRKGAADTFDAGGYVALLRRIRQEHDQVVYAPSFERDLEEAIAGAIAVQPQDEVIVTEGNYLLSPVGLWPQAKELMDQVWFCELEAEERRRRLVARHVQFGKDPEAAAAWVSSVDEPNAALVDQWKSAADRVLCLT